MATWIDALRAQSKTYRRLQTWAAASDCYFRRRFTPDFSRFTHIVILYRAKYLYLRVKNQTNEDEE